MVHSVEYLRIRDGWLGLYQRSPKLAQAKRAKELQRRERRRREKKAGGGSREKGALMGENKERSGGRARQG
ncbi:unnamed protein product [Prunus armeniaca]|uniref:Uncharacterized protein n=1 Tax=Prunus armeniaca TaxID=36596 RepID=A0A6J5WQ01_PRUAR|nr:unnamed protein product [Prunus armeniaca]